MANDVITKCLNRIIPYDKSLHFVVGSVLFLPIAFILKFFFEIDNYGISIITLSAVTVIAVLKELYDKISNTGTPDAIDVVYSLMGAVLSLFIFLTGGLAC